ncbi:MAG: serine/threonine-protein kinase, partial [Gemmatimonadales bacterium]
MTASEDLRQALADRYVIESELGRGGMATVYLARDLRHDRPVALKVLHPELAAALGPERFQREIRMAARLQHPHILTVHDSGEAAGRLWFTMPFVDGESLRDRLNRERQLPVKDAVRLTREAALALDFAHRHDTIHRDIKPENILLVDGQALVADFGIARGLAAEGESKLTQTGLAIGTPAYMSPEQAAGDRSVDARTDIYSLGTVLYEMLAGEPPFTGPTAQSMIARRLTESPRPIREIRDTVPENVAQAALKALSRSPADRFATAAEFARALETSPVTGTQPTVQVRAPGRRHPPLTLALGIGFVLGLGVLFGWLRSHGTADTAEGKGPKLLAVLP